MEIRGVIYLLLPYGLRDHTEVIRLGSRCLYSEPPISPVPLISLNVICLLCVVDIFIITCYEDALLLSYLSGVPSASYFWMFISLSRDQRDGICSLLPDNIEELFTLVSS